MYLRLIFIILACGMAFAHNIDRLDEQDHQAGSSFDTEIHLVQSKSVHRRQSPELVADDAVRETGSLTAVKISDISQDTGSVDKNKRSLNNVQPGHVAEPGCCG